jgi:hypothetical protein
MQLKNGDKKGVLIGKGLRGNPRLFRDGFRFTPEKQIPDTVRDSIGDKLKSSALIS